jgi:hypothetical protein
MSKLIKELCKLFQITKIETSSYHPQTNSAVERMNSVIIQTLRKYCSADQENWPSILPSILMAYRMTPCTQSTQYSPFFLMFGRHPLMPLDVALIPPSNMGRSAAAHLREILENHEIAQEIARENIKLAQEKFTKQYDKKTSDPKFKPGDRVWLYSTRTPKNMKAKLCQKYVGPYYVCISFPNHVYKLRRCKDNHLVKSLIHANRLKPCVDPDLRPTNIPDMFQRVTHEMNPEEIPDDTMSENDKETPQTQPTTGSQGGNTQTHTQNNVSQQSQLLLVDRLIKTANIRGVRHYFVKWKDKGIPNSWEPASNIPHALQRDYHIHNTLKGFRRKRPLLSHQYP